jgi:signal transduction histidine kinase
MLILSAHPGHPVGRLAVVGPTIATTGTALLEFCVRRLDTAPHDVGAALGATVGTTGRGVGWLLLVLFVPLVFPEGHRTGPPRLTRWAWRAATTVLAVDLVIALFSPGQTDLRIADVDNPIGLPKALNGAMDTLSALFLLLAVASIGLAIACVVSRYRHGSALRRQQLLWFGLSFAPPIVLFALSAGDGAQPWMFGAATLPVPIAVGIAVRQRRLYDIQLAVNRSLTYGTLWLLIAVLYAAMVGGIGAMLRQRGADWLPWVAAGIVAVSFAPLRDGLQRAANRITYGQWARPDEVISRTTRRLADTADLPGLLGSLAAELVDGLGLGYVEITDRDGGRLASAGVADGPLDELAMTAYGQQVGVLRWRRRSLRDSDRTLLAGLAAQLGSVVHANGLFESIRATQERLVLGREEERRRLRRDLHDGLGPALAGLTLQVDTVRNQLASAADPDAALLDLRTGIQHTVLDVRRIVEGLRPPALDDLGLLEAVRQLAGRRSNSGPPAVEVAVAPLPRLPAAVEVAAYRIVQEALSNAVRHAAARTVRISLALGTDGLEVVVADDGTGVVVPRADGVGLGSMRERAEEIGGRFELLADRGKGTTVTATLPLVIS